MKTSIPLLALATALALGPLSSFAAPPQAAPATSPAKSQGAARYEIDAVHSAVVFRCKHLGVSWAYGRFNAISGSFVIDEQDPKSSKVDVVIQTASVDTADTKRDEHLRGPDFLDVKQFPEARFVSTSVQPDAGKASAGKAGAGKEWEVAGQLTLHGVTKDVTLRMEHVGSAQDPFMGKIAGFHGTLVIRRADYGISYSPEALGDEVTLLLSIEGGQR
jgi:polyisoprenoid-binding protein YceI